MKQPGIPVILGRGALVAGLALCLVMVQRGSTAAAESSPASQSVHGQAWLTSYDAAVALSKATGKPIMMDFTGSDWCGWCKKLKSEVFDTPQFNQWAKKSVVLLELDYPRSIPQSDKLKAQNSQLSAKYQIEGYPTILFVSPAGKVLGKYGYDRGGPKVWTGKASAMLAGK